MYDAKLRDGDVVLEPSARIAAVRGADARLQRAYILIKTKKGSFKYNRELGADYDALASAKNEAELEQILNEALAPLDDAYVRVVSAGQSVTAEIVCGDKTRTTEVTPNGNI